MKRHILMFGLVALTIAAAAAIIFHRPPPTSRARESAELKRPSLDPQLLGAQSCAGSVCHGGIEVGRPRSEFTTWLSLDPHARAYSTLANEKSQAIIDNLSPLGASPHKTAAHAEPLCLKCHVDPQYERAQPGFRRADGVGCESCHGAAEGWLEGHYRNGGSRAGMKDTKGLPGRATACVGCHVGMPGNDVDHALIAAGHPALRFEFATYFANLPRHWDDQKSKVGDPRDFEARAWATGQLVTSSRALELLAHRATGTTWPEFAEFDCFACHHDLHASSWRQRDPKRRPGSLVPSDWYTAMLPEIIDAKDEQVRGLLAEIRNLSLPPAKLASSAKRLAVSLQETAQGPARENVLEPFRVRSCVDRSWDEAAQRYFALLALRQWDKDKVGTVGPPLER